MASGLIGLEERKKIVFVEKLEEVIEIKLNAVNTSHQSNTFGTPPETEAKEKPPKKESLPVQLPI
jgi:hypothetical protein